MLIMHVGQSSQNRSRTDRFDSGSSAIVGEKRAFSRGAFSYLANWPARCAISDRPPLTSNLRRAQACSFARAPRNASWPENETQARPKRRGERSSRYVEIAFEIHADSRPRSVETQRWHSWFFGFVARMSKPNSCSSPSVHPEDRILLSRFFILDSCSFFGCFLPFAYLALSLPWSVCASSADRWLVSCNFHQVIVIYCIYTFVLFYSSLMCPFIRIF